MALDFGMRRENQRHRIGGDVRVEFGRNPTQQLDKLGLAQFLGASPRPCASSSPPACRPVGAA